MGGGGAGPSTGQPPQESSSSSSLTQILVVEDDSSTRKIVKRFLEKRLPDTRVTAVTSGSEAMQLLEQGHRFDLVLSDVFMPGIDGPQLVDKMRRLPPSRETPVIFMSVTKRVEVVNECWRKGGFDFLSKPLKLKEMEKAVSDCLVKHGHAGLPGIPGSSPLGPAPHEDPLYMEPEPQPIPFRSKTTTEVAIHDSLKRRRESLATGEVGSDPEAKKFRILHLCDDLRAELLGERAAFCYRKVTGDGPIGVHSVPPELLALVFSFLSGRELGVVIRVFREWREIVLNHDVLARRFYQSRYRTSYFVHNTVDWKTRVSIMADVCNNWRAGSCQVFGAPGLDLSNPNTVRQVSVGTYQHRFAAASHDGYIRVWEARNKSLNAQIPTGPATTFRDGDRPDFYLKIAVPRPGAAHRPVPFLRLKQSSVVVGFKDGAVICLDTDSGEWEWHLQMHQSSSMFEGMHLHENMLLAYTKSSPVVDVWDVCTRSHLKSFVGHRKRVLCLDSDGNFVATGSADKTIIGWDLDTAQRLSTFEGHEGPVYAMHMGRNYIAAGSHDRTVKIWDRRSAECVMTLSEAGHRGPVTCVQWDEVMNRVVSGGDDAFVCVWDVRKNHCLSRLEDPAGKAISITCMAIDDEKIVTGHTDGGVNLWNFRRA